MFLLSLNPIHASAAQNGIIPSRFKENSFSFGAETTYLTTSANYDDGGNSNKLPDQYGYSAFQTLIYGRYDLTQELSFFSELPMNYTSSENTTDTYSAFKVPGLAIGMNYNLDISFVNIIPEFKGYYALEKFDRGSDEVLGSDGANYVDMGSHLFMNFSNLVWHSYLSYQYRMDGFSSLINYQTDLAYKTESGTFVLGVKGFESISDDENSSNPLYRHSYLAIINGGSLMYGAVDPARTDLFAQAKVAMGDFFDFYGSATKSLRGKNSADMMSFTVGFEYLLGGRVLRTKPAREDQFQYNDEETDSRFEEKIRNYNQPKKKVKPKKLRKKPRPKNSSDFTEVSTSNDLEVSRKHFGKKSSSTSPIPKQKSKKPKRVNIDF